MASATRLPQQTLQQLLERVRRSKQVTRQEYLHLTSLLLGLQRLSVEERIHINRIFDSIQAGTVKIL